MKGAGRGFASMDPERRRQLAQRGGRRAHELKRAHTFDKAEAAEAGKKGGLITGAQRHAAAQAKDRTPPAAAPAPAPVVDGSCSKCAMPGPEHKMCRGNS